MLSDDLKKNEITQAQLDYILGLGEKHGLNSQDLAARATKVLEYFVKFIENLNKKEASLLIAYLKEL